MWAASSEAGAVKVRQLRLIRLVSALIHRFWQARIRTCLYCSRLWVWSTTSNELILNILQSHFTLVLVHLSRLFLWNVILELGGHLKVWMTRGLSLLRWLTVISLGLVVMKAGAGVVHRFVSFVYRRNLNSLMIWIIVRNISKGISLIVLLWIISDIWWW